MRADAVRVGGLFGFAALLVSGAAVAFERASTDVMTAGPVEYSHWVTTYHAELLTQSLFFGSAAGCCCCCSAVSVRCSRGLLARPRRCWLPVRSGSA